MLEDSLKPIQDPNHHKNGLLLSTIFVLCPMPIYFRDHHKWLQTPMAAELAHSEEMSDKAMNDIFQVELRNGKGSRE